MIKGHKSLIYFTCTVCSDPELKFYLSVHENREQCKYYQSQLNHSDKSYSVSYVHLPIGKATRQKKYCPIFDQIKTHQYGSCFIKS